MSCRTLQYPSQESLPARIFSGDRDLSTAWRKNPRSLIAKVRTWRTVLFTILTGFTSLAIFGAETGIALPALTSPAPGSVLSGSTVSFSWTASSGVTAYQLWVGSTVGTDNLGLCSVSTTTCNVTGLPTNGSAIYVALAWEISGVWQTAKYIYTAAAAPKPTLSISATSIAFGNVNVNTPVTYTVILTSTGTAALTVSATAVTGTGYTVSGASFPLTLTPNQTAALIVKFDPTAVGAAAGTLTLTSNSSTGVSTAIALSGVGISLLPALASPAPGSVLSGSTVSFTWTAGSGVTAYQLWVGSTVGSDNLGLCAISTTTCKLTDVPMNGTKVYVMLAWEISGVWQTAKYTYIAAAAAAAPKPTLSALSCTSASITGAGIDSCTVKLNSAAGSGGLAVSLSSSNTNVTVQSSVTVAAGAATASFTATVAAITTAQTATLTASAGGVAELFVIDLGGAAPALTLQSTSIAFGDVTESGPVYQSVTLTSSGSAPLTISAGSTTGAGFTLFGISFPLTLSPKQTTTLQIEFDPTAPGAASGKLTLTSNSSTGATSTISLSGTGVAGKYEVNVTWSAPASSQVPISGYYVYRAAEGGSTFLRLNPTVDTATTYTDTSVVEGATYVYYVESVDSAGVTSVPSASITIAVP